VDRGLGGMMSADQVAVAIEETEIVIRIPITYLPTALDCAMDGGHVAGEYKVTDPAQFAHGILSVLQDEREDGTTLVHGLLDKAIEDAIDGGEVEGIAEADEDEDEEEDE